MGIGKVASEARKTMGIIASEAGKAFLSYFEVDADVMSPKMKSIMSNPEDRKKYLEAIERLRENGPREEPVTIELSNGEEMTITHIQ